MKKIIFFLLFVAIFLPFTKVSAETMIAKSASNPEAYYIENGEKYLFPNPSVYFSWFSSFKQVETISKGRLDQKKFIGKIWYRPGWSLVKPKGSNKVYTISQDTWNLRWIKSPQVAKNLYGSNWQTLIQDVESNIFNYFCVGDSINKSSDYDEVAAFRTNRSLAHYIKTRNQSRNCDKPTSEKFVSRSKEKRPQSSKRHRSNEDKKKPSKVKKQSDSATKDEKSVKSKKKKPSSQPLESNHQQDNANSSSRSDSTGSQTEKNKSDNNQDSTKEAEAPGNREEVTKEDKSNVSNQEVNQEKTTNKTSSSSTKEGSLKNNTSTTKDKKESSTTKKTKEDNDNTSSADEKTESSTKSTKKDKSYSTGQMPNKETKAMWVWNSQKLVENHQKQNKFFQFVKAPHGDKSDKITRIYFNSWDFALEEAPKKLQQFIKRAHENDIKVEYLAGNENWVKDSEKKYPIEECKEVVEYNKSTSEISSYDGVHFDIEPHVLGSVWHENSESGDDNYNDKFQNNLVDIVETCNSKFENNNQNLTLSLDLGSDYSYYVTDLMDDIDKIDGPVDYVTVMNYFDNKERFINGYSGKSFGGVKHNLRLYDHLPLVFGAETGDGVQDKITFAEEGVKAMESVFEQAYSQYKSNSQFAGFSVHYYEKYSSLQQ